MRKLRTIEMQRLSIEEFKEADKAVRQVLEDIHFDGIGVVESDMPRASNEKAFASACRNLAYLREIQMID